MKEGRDIVYCHPEQSEGSLKELKFTYCYSVEILRLCLRMTVVFILFSSTCHADIVTPQVCHLNNCVSVEVVSKDADMERGLMYRKSLDADKGMLFVFSFDDKQSFWMKNMHFSLDILWISADQHIVYIGKNIPACAADPCPVYTPDKNARYVLELISGYTSSHQWNLGDKLDLKGI